jgi:hypothetical protein
LIEAGRASVVNNPMMATTSMISTNVNPCSGLLILILMALSPFERNAWTVKASPIPLRSASRHLEAKRNSPDFSGLFPSSLPGAG